ncbi:B12-binding domain-containing radical SAM protein [Parabacteroides sp. FAFU027]|uniref:B12-binding domain-containing radical SAM protein n=1 Tax=Parabacteroides sp. FAFU027 TaxID=2922715 RepID=UPI001FAECBED|nr:radical SAM protein [Parabacteroides sp. FAFU027]
MRVLFVRPKPSPETIGLQHVMIVEPLELEVLATLIQAEHEVRIVDLILEKKELVYFLKEFVPQAVCVTGYITHIPVMIECCHEAKLFNDNIITIVGGVHIEKFPDDIEHQAVDYRVIRNATRTFPQLISFLAQKADFPQGVLRKNEIVISRNLPDYDFYFPIPDRSLTQKYRGKYFYVFHDKVALVKTSFGCPYHCKFCYCRKITDDHYFTRPLEEVIEELSGIREKEIYIVDDDFLVSRNRVAEFIRLLKENNISKKYLIYGRADFIVCNPDVIKDFREVGLRTVIVGLESFNDQELSGFHKESDSNINMQAMAVLNQNKVDCYAAVIVSPSWSENDFRKAGDVMLELGIKFVNLQPLTPLRGTGIEIDDRNLIIPRDEYAKWDLAHVTIRPEKMSVTDYYRNIMKLYQRIILNPKTLLRHAKYPLYLQLRMMVGVKKVQQQYRNKIMETGKDA